MKELGTEKKKGISIGYDVRKQKEAEKSKGYLG